MLIFLMVDFETRSKNGIKQLNAGNEMYHTFYHLKNGSTTRKICRYNHLFRSSYERAVGYTDSFKHSVPPILFPPFRRETIFSK
jgi:hypothetical protein